jgi:hypothetical protein
MRNKTIQNETNYNQNEKYGDEDSETEPQRNNFQTKCSSISVEIGYLGIMLLRFIILLSVKGFVFWSECAHHLNNVSEKGHVSDDIQIQLLQKNQSEHKRNYLEGSARAGKPMGPSMVETPDLTSEGDDASLLVRRLHRTNAQENTSFSRVTSIGLGVSFF